MNERIKEFEAQCWEYRDGYEGGEGWYTVFNKQKFAELIIRRCIIAAGQPPPGLISEDTWYAAIHAAVCSIQDEFGLDHSFGV